MRLQIKALAISLAVAWGGLVLLAGLAHLVWPAYGAEFWELVASIYPGVGAIGLGTLALATGVRAARRAGLRGGHRLGL